MAWLAVLSLAIWVYLVFARGRFWGADERLETSLDEQNFWPALAVVIPARNEADTIGAALRSLLNQNYAGSLSIILVDDQSDDGTEAIANNTAGRLPLPRRSFLTTRVEALPEEWTGKMWAVYHGLTLAAEIAPEARYVLLTDADIEHHADSVRQLVQKAESDQLDLVSLMVLLHCESLWERLLIPAFVFYFQKLYPFPWVNDAWRQTAAAAGGCMLVRRTALDRIGGIASIRGELIDDCALARAVKRGGPIWLGLTRSTRSLRRYARLGGIWHMVTRTAYTQLQHSFLLLVGGVSAMVVTYLAPPIAVIYGVVFGAGWLAIAAAFAWLLMLIAYVPTLRLYRLPALLGLMLPVAALFYTLMTIDSARRHWQGRGGAWKARHCAPPNS